MAKMWKTNHRQILLLTEFYEWKFLNSRPGNFIVILSIILRDP